MASTTLLVVPGIDHAPPEPGSSTFIGETHTATSDDDTIRLGTYYPERSWYRVEKGRENISLMCGEEAGDVAVEYAETRCPIVQSMRNDVEHRLF